VNTLICVYVFLIFNFYDSEIKKIGDGFVPIDFSQYSNFLDKDNITVLLSNRTKNVAGFKDVDGATRTCLVHLANTVPMFTLDKICHFMSSYHLQ